MAPTKVPALSYQCMICHSFTSTTLFYQLRDDQFSGRKRGRCLGHHSCDQSGRTTMIAWSQGVKEHSCLKIVCLLYSCSWFERFCPSKDCLDKICHSQFFHCAQRSNSAAGLASHLNIHLSHCTNYSICIIYSYPLTPLGQLLKSSSV